MPETVITTDDDGDVLPAAESAHVAAVAEGAAAVQSEHAAESAGKAEMAAEAAIQAAQANVAAGAEAVAAAASAGESASAAAVSAEMMHQAITAQTAAISALVEELRTSRKSGPRPDGDAPKVKPDKTPGQSSDRRRHWYYG